MYKALYRKWRPLTFDDVVSQPHITTTLRNQLINEKTAHAYLFTGSRGTGKTTCARIFAKTINCPNQADGNPCLTCEICKSADDGALSDIIEIDAASNTGVDDIRELRDSTIYTPERCKYKVYIIDEVHMLSISAFNALLKIMEEPPSYVKFILATTEVHKVPATILSRCQRYDFRRILNEDIIERLNYISSQEGIDLDEQAAALISRISDGGMRDALSILDQCIAFTEGKIDIDAVSNAAGIAGRDYLFEILEFMVDKNPAGAISVVDKLYSMSKDMQRLCEELLSQMRNIMLLKTMKDAQNLLSCLPFEIDKLREISNKMELDEILEKLSILQECNEKLGRAISKRVEIEMCLIKLCSAAQVGASHTKSSSSEISALLNRISELEGKISNSSFSNDFAKSANSKKADTKPMASKPSNESEHKNSVEPEVIDSTKITPINCWGEICDRIESVNPAVSGALQNSTAFLHENLVLLTVQNEFLLQLIKIKDNYLSIQKSIKDVLGETYQIKARSAKIQKVEKEAPIDKLIKKAQDSNIDVEIV